MCCPVIESSPGGVSGLGNVTQVEQTGEPIFVSDVEKPPEEKPPEETPPEETPPEETPPEETPPEETPHKFAGDFNYTVKGQQRIMPEWAQAACVDEASNKAVKEIFEKAEGFDHVKSDRDNLQQWHDEVQPTLQNVNMLNGLLEQGNLAAFFQGCQIPFQNVLNWSLQYAQMTPDQQASMRGQAQQVFAQHHNEVSNQNTMTSYQQQLIASREREVNLVLSRPDVAAAAAQIDQRFNRVGVLREEIINRGQYYGSQGVDKSAEEIMNEVLSFSGVQLGGQPAAPPPNNNLGGGGQPPPAGAGPVPQNRGTMTNLRGSGRSPARKVIRSRKDLRERASQLEAQGR